MLQDFRPVGSAILDWNIGESIKWFKALFYLVEVVEALEFPRRVVLNFSVIVGVLRNKGEDVRIVRELEAKAKIATTTINAFEVYYGAFKSRDSKRNLVAVKGFLSNC